MNLFVIILCLRIQEVADDVRVLKPSLLLFVDQLQEIVYLYHHLLE